MPGDFIIYVLWCAIFPGDLQKRSAAIEHSPARNCADDDSAAEADDRILRPLRGRNPYTDRYLNKGAECPDYNFYQMHRPDLVSGIDRHDIKP